MRRRLARRWRRIPFGARFAICMAGLVLIVGAIPLEIAGRQSLATAQASAAASAGVGQQLLAAQERGVATYADNVSNQLAQVPAAGQLGVAERDTQGVATTLVLVAPGRAPQGIAAGATRGGPGIDAIVSAAAAGQKVAPLPDGGAVVLGWSDQGGRRVIAAQSIPVQLGGNVVVIRQGRAVQSGVLNATGVGAGQAIDPAILSVLGKPAGTTVVLGGNAVVVDSVELGSGCWLVATVPVNSLPVLDLPGILLVAFALVGMLLVFVMVQDDLQRPLRRLERAVSAMAREDFSVALPAGGDDEIGRLTHSVDNMRRLLHDSLQTTRIRAAVASTLNSTGTTHSALAETCAALCEVTGVEASAILVANSEIGPAFAASAGQAEMLAVADLLSGGGPFGIAFRAPAGTVLALGAIPPCLEAEQGIRQMCVAPLRVGIEPPLGVLALISDDEAVLGHAVTLMHPAIDQIALALERYRVLAMVERQASTDDLTGLYNHRFFVDYLAQQLSLADRQRTPVSVMMFDLDHFKVLNDTYGHQAGDSALRAFAATLRETIRRSDLAARYGGEEFVAVMANTSAAEARMVAEKVRDAVERCEINTDVGVLRITVSIGVATFPEQIADPQQLLRVADTALYAAKHGGRNRVRSAEGMCLDDKELAGSLNEKEPSPIGEGSRL